MKPLRWHAAARANTAPPELGPTLTVRQAAAALGMPARTLRRYLKRRVVQGEQFLPHSPWIIPTTEVERVAEVLNTAPDWRAATTVAELAIVASSPARRAESGE